MKRAPLSDESDIMKTKQNPKRTQPWCLALALIVITLSVQAQEPGVAVRVAELKANIAANQAALKQYEWIETTVVSVKEKERSRKQEERCYRKNN